MVASLDEAILASDNPDLTTALRRLVSDAGHVWSTAGNLEHEADRDSQNWELILDYQLAALEV